MEVADDWETRTNRDAPGDETWPMAQGHGEAELSSGRSAQTMLEKKEGQVKGTVKYKRGLVIRKKREEM